MKEARRLDTILRMFVVAWVLPVLCAGQELPDTRRVDGLATSLARAESAFDRGEVVAAERGYVAVLALEPEHPRALFRLAQLRRTDHSAAAALLERYIELVPSDAWGHLALADAFARGGDAIRARQAYAEALAHAPDDRDIRLGYPRLLERLGRTDEAIDAYLAWLTGHPADGEVWRELASAQQRAGSPRGAVRALERAQALAPNDSELARRIETLRVRSAPAVQVGIIAAGETGASSNGTSIGADFPAGDRARVGVHYDRRRVSSFGDMAQTERLGFRATGRLRSDIQLYLSSGVRWMPSSEGPMTSGPRPDAAFRIRRAGAAEGLILDAKVQRDPIDVTPELVRAPVSRTQVVTSVDLPVGGPWRARGQVRAAALTRQDEDNRRTGVTAGMGMSLAPEVRLSGQWHQTWNSNPAARGYFAPAVTQVAELGFELEREYNRATVALDAGGGVQRFQRATRLTMGSWRPTARIWGLVAWNLGTRQQLLLEADSYDSQIADAVIVADHWRYGSLTVSMRVALR